MSSVSAATEAAATGYLDGVTAQSFDWRAYLAQFPERLLSDPEGRRVLTRLDPLLFAILYVSRHLRGQGEAAEMTFAECHLDWCREAREWVRPASAPRAHRDVYVGPRAVGKSSWWFLALPLWAGAHGHARFAAAFSDSSAQAEGHLGTFKAELDGNGLLRRDYPDLCTPARRPAGVQVADNRAMLHTKAGFVFAARGIDSGNLGLKVGEARPDLLILDDVEPGEANYSAHQAEKRLSTLQNVILPLNEFARTVIVGTVTMPGSVMHQFVKHGRNLDAPAWIGEENFRVHCHDAILTADDGTERSLWPAKWPLDYLQSIRHTRSFELNFANNPRGYDGGFWSPEHFRYNVPAGVSRRILSIDPAGTSRSTSDYTGLAVVGYSPVEKRVVVLYSAQVKLTPAALREKCLALISLFDVHGALVETNSGGDAWPSVLNLPVKTVTLHQTEPKQVRAAQVLDYYEAGWVAHDGLQPAFEDQAVAFPHAAHDDVVDAVGSAVHLFLKDRRAPVRRRESTSAYA